MTDNRSWFTLDSSAQPVGPFSVADLVGWAKQGHVSDTQVFWREGKEAWDKLTDISELEEVITTLRQHQAAPSSASATGPGTHSHHHQVFFSAKASDPLEAFKHEIAAVEADEAAAATAVDETAAPDRTGTPDELEFEDDDGTLYKWDPLLRNVRQMLAMPSRGRRRATQQRRMLLLAAVAHQQTAHQQTARQQQMQQQRRNTSVYVTGLPDDTDVDEVAGVFDKCGIIKLDEQGQPKIKLYRDKQTGDLKGDGLVTYLKEPSVQLACQILDGSHFRATGGRQLSVTPAQFEMKGGQYMDKKKKSQGAAGGGGGGKGKGGRGGKGKKGRGPLSQADKLEKKLGWGGFDDVLPHEKVTVVLHHMFSPAEAAEGGGSFATDLEAEVAAECAKLGAVEKVRVFAAHPEGVVTVRFKQEEPAQACLEKMNGRFFGGLQIQAHMWDGFTSYHLSINYVRGELPLVDNKGPRGPGVD
eukprot:gene3215-3492_t